MMFSYVCMRSTYLKWAATEKSVKMTMTSYISYIHTEYILLCMMIGLANVRMFMISDDDCLYVRYVYQYDSPDLF